MGVINPVRFIEDEVTEVIHGSMRVKTLKIMLVMVVLRYVQNSNMGISLKVRISLIIWLMVHWSGCCLENRQKWVMHWTLYPLPGKYQKVWNATHTMEYLLYETVNGIQLAVTWDHKLISHLPDVLYPDYERGRRPNLYLFVNWLTVFTKSCPALSNPLRSWCFLRVNNLSFNATEAHHNRFLD